MELHQIKDLLLDENKLDEAILKKRENMSKLLVASHKSRSSKRSSKNSSVAGGSNKKDGSSSIYDRTSRAGLSDNAIEKFKTAKFRTEDSERQLTEVDRDIENQEIHMPGTPLRK